MSHENTYYEYNIFVLRSIVYLYKDSVELYESEIIGFILPLYAMKITG